MKYFIAFSLLVFSLVGCDKPNESVAQITQGSSQCVKDTDCKGNRICESGECVNPVAIQNLSVKPELATAIVPAAPAVAYEAIMVSGYEAGPFTVEHAEMGNTLNYQSRAGVMDLLEYVAPDASSSYVVIEKAYSFGPNKYVLIISTGERGRSCAATTYAFSFDTKSESVDGVAEIDGCSEIVEAFADGNKLSIKKENEITIVYNGLVN
ncbi:MAG: hypothetical protein RBR82_05445 [Pseudomonas sp.]|nr:hypothetical protein [Pseudomonas sp.]